MSQWLLMSNDPVLVPFSRNSNDTENFQTIITLTCHSYLLWICCYRNSHVFCCIKSTFWNNFRWTTYIRFVIKRWWSTRILFFLHSSTLPSSLCWIQLSFL